MFDDSKDGVLCINNICDDRQCCLAPVTCGNSGGANLPYVCTDRTMALDPKKKVEHCADRACTDDFCCAGVCKPGARCLLAPPAEVKLTTSAKLKTVGKAASRDDILAGLATQLGSDAAKCEGADFGGTELECLDTVGTCEVGDSVDGSITTRAACDTAAGVYTGTATYVHGGSAVEDVVVKTTAEIPMADDGSICGDAADAKVKVAAEKSMCFNLHQCTGPSVGSADCSGCTMTSDCAALRRRLTDGRRQLVSTHTLTFTAETTDDVGQTLVGQADSLAASFLDSLVEASKAAGVVVRTPRP